MRFGSRVDARPLLPANEPLRTIVERWACWGWPVTKAAIGQRPAAARAALIRWLNSPEVFAAYRRAGARWDPGWYRELLPCVAEEYRFVEPGAAPPPPTVATGGATAPTPQRNEEMYWLRYSGRLTFAEIGARFGLSTSRARQIVLRMERRTEVWTPEKQVALEGQWPRP